ncbi:N-acetyltransferase Eis [Streptomyces badius]
MIDTEKDRAGASPLGCVLAERDGEVTGYATFRVRPDWDRAGPKGTVALRDLGALDPASYAALWRFLFGIDLTSSVEAGPRPMDEPLMHLVSDVRRCEARVQDALYLRLVEVGAALEAKVYWMRLGGCGAGGRGRLLPVERGALAPGGGRQGRCLVPACAGSRAGSGAVGTGAGRRLPRRGVVHLARGGGAGAGGAAGAVEEVSSAFSWHVEPWLPHGF